MSAAEQFKAAVTSEAFPIQGWRGGLERSHARRGRSGWVLGLPTYVLEIYNLQKWNGPNDSLSARASNGMPATRRRSGTGTG
jgi:hypothetical protein